MSWQQRKVNVFCKATNTAVLTLTYLWFRSSSFSALNLLLSALWRNFTCKQYQCVQYFERNETTNYGELQQSEWLLFTSAYGCFNSAPCAVGRIVPRASSSSFFCSSSGICGLLSRCSCRPCKLGVFSSPCPPGFYPQPLLKCPCRAPSPPFSPLSSAVLCQM